MLNSELGVNHLLSIFTQCACAWLNTRMQLQLLYTHTVTVTVSLASSCQEKKKPSKLNSFGVSDKYNGMGNFCGHMHRNSITMHHQVYYIYIYIYIDRCGLSLSLSIHNMIYDSFIAMPNSTRYCLSLNVGNVFQRLMQPCSCRSWFLLLP